MQGFANIDPLRLQELQSQAGLLLVDVRTDQEVGRGMIPGARHIPLHLLPERLDELDPAPVVVFYCQSGARSAQASAFASSRGGREIYNLAGGILAWAGRGLPLTGL
jgi:rhodanese-related sulfurtransferase